MYLFVSPGHAWQVSPEIASTVRSRYFLSIDHHRVTLKRNNKVTYCFTQYYPVCEYVHIPEVHS